MKIAIITYDRPHRKTQDLVFGLMAHAHTNLTLIAIPWKERTNYMGLYAHRPTSCIDIIPQNFAENLGLGFHHYPLASIGEILEHVKPDKVVIGGAGIIPEATTKEWNIINSHPGWLPNVRGLDALKWAIYRNETIGCTTFQISGETDTGWMIMRRETPLLLNDSIYSLAQRHYDLEIRMLVDAVNEIPTKTFLGTQYDFKGQVPSFSCVHKRMPHEKELLLPDILKKRILEGVG